MVGLRPIVVMALALLGGMVCGLHSPLNPLTCLLPAAGVIWALTLWGTHQHCRWAPLALVGTFCLVGCLWARSDAMLRQQRSLTPLLRGVVEPGAPVAVTLSGRITSAVTTDAAGRCQRFDLGCNQVSLPDDSLAPVRHTVAVRLYGRSARRPRYGENWSIQGRLWQNDSPRGTTFTLAAGVRGLHALPSKGGHWARGCLRWRQHAATVLAHDLTPYPVVTSIIHAMTLGYREKLARSTRLLFSRAGAAHLFAVSGLHVAILVAMVVFLLGGIGIPRTRWLWFVLPIMVGYIFATGARPSAIRAGVMAVIFLGAPLLGRRSNGAAALALAAILITLWNPRQLRDVGAIYSFVVVAGIMILHAPLMRRAASLWQPDPLDATSPARARRWGRKASRSLLSLAIVSLSAWLSSIPLTALYFGHCSLVAVPCNLLVIPVAFLSLTSSVLSLLVSGLCLPLSALFNNANAALLSLMMAALRPVAALPWACVEVPPFSGWLVPLWYIGLWGPALWERARHPADRRANEGATAKTSDLR